MSDHLERGIRLHVEKDHESWAIREIGNDGAKIGSDRMPWNWMLAFWATSCVLIEGFKIEARFSAQRGKHDGPAEIGSSRIIRLSLQSGINSDDTITRRVAISMFGTERTIQHVMLDVGILDDANEMEHCDAWGMVAHTAEIDFRKETYDDTLWFYLYVKSETFARYANLIERGAVKRIAFNVGAVDGFYSEWSPSISTDRVKVLTQGDEHKLEVPPDLQIKPPRLGKVGVAHLTMTCQLDFTEREISPVTIRESEAADPVVQPPIQVTSIAPPSLAMAMISLRRASWIIVVLLAIIAVTTIFKF